MAIRIVVTITGLIVLIGAIVAVKWLQISALIQAGEQMGAFPETVGTVNAEYAVWESTLNAVGTLEAVRGVTVAAEIPGKVVNIAFESGANVAAGDVLVEQGISSEKAQLRAAEAGVVLAKSELDRSAKLLRQQVASKSQYDTANAQYKQAVAEADNIRTTIEKKTIKAPFAGRLGIRLVNLGEDLSSGDEIVSLQTMNPIFVNFSLPQQQLSKLAQGLEVRLSTDAVPGTVFNGTITAINPEVDSSTRNIRIQATLENPQELLLPGMYARVEVVLPETAEYLIVPN